VTRGDSATDPLVARIRRLEHRARALEPGAARRKRLRRAVQASAERHLRSLDTRRAFIDTEDKGVGLRAMAIEERGHALDRVMALFEHEVVRPGCQPASGGHLAYTPGGGLYYAALGDYLAAVSNKYAGVFFPGPGAVRMENLLIRWVADLVGYPASAGGNLASGGSIANLEAIATARHAHGLKGADYATAVVYDTTQAHYCIEKALNIAGLAEVQVRHVAMDERWRMRPDALAKAIAADRRAGLRPWLIVAVAGTTDVGAVDPLDAIADVARAEGCWFHVDAAYGGFFLLTEQGRLLMKGIERSDSAVLDPHKGLFLPYGTGVVVVRDARAMAATHAYTGHYMQDALPDPSEISPADLSLELSKHFRGPRMWLPLVLAGTAPFAAALEEKLLLARYFRREVAALGFEVGPEPELSVVTFRWAPAGMDLVDANRLNAAIVEGVRRDGRVFLSSTMLEGRYTIRLAAVSFRTHRRTIDLALKVLRERVEALEGRVPAAVTAPPLDHQEAP